MTQTSAALWIPIAVLGAGTFGIRFAGVTLRSRITLSARLLQALTRASVILLMALVSTATIFEGQAFAGGSRIIGVAVGGVLAWRRAPFVLVVLAAAGVTAGLRSVGLS